ncbi:MAG: class IV adenylate cyclase [Planctomycetes bacterium]|nr:class IV adenylate cyclase [Planctomycetota bacterium]
MPTNVPLEIELKLRVESHEPVREKLRAAEATFVRRALERNLIFDRPDGSLRRQGVGLRVRSLDIEGEKQGPDETHPTLTVKGPRLPGPMKAREEREVAISDAQTAARMFEMLGFVCILSYEKRRETWQLGPCLVELDEPPRIGLFVEIEGPDEQAIRRVQTTLGLAGVPHVPQSYVHMLADYCDTHSIAARVLRLTYCSLHSQ